MSTQFRIVLTVIFGLVFVSLGTYFVLKLQGFVFDPTIMSFSRTGGISLHVSPRDATFLLDGVIISESPSIIQDTLYINDLLPGRYHIIGEKDGYANWEKYLSVSPGFVSETIEAKLWMNPMPSSSFSLSFNSPIQRFFPTRYGVIYEFAAGSVRLDTGALKGARVVSLSQGFDRVITESSPTFFYTDLRRPESALNVNGLSSLLLLQSSLTPPNSSLSRVFFDPTDDDKLILLFGSSLYSLDVADQTIGEITPTFGARILPELSQVFEEYFFGVNTEGRLVVVNTVKKDVSILPITHPVSSFEIISESSIIFLTSSNELYLFDVLDQASIFLGKDVSTYSVSPDKNKVLTLSLRGGVLLLSLDSNILEAEGVARSSPILFHSREPVNSISFFDQFHFLFSRGGSLYIGEADKEQFSNVALVCKDVSEYEFFEDGVYVVDKNEDELLRFDL